MVRSQRLAEVIRKEVADILLTKMRDKRLAFVTITDVKVSKDLSAAKIFFSVLDQKKFDVVHAERAMRDAAGFIRREIGHRIEMRIVPTLQFAYDDSIARGVALVHRINQIAAEDAKRHPSEPPAAA